MPFQPASLRVESNNLFNEWAHPEKVNCGVLHYILNKTNQSKDEASDLNFLAFLLNIQGYS